MTGYHVHCVEFDDGNAFDVRSTPRLLHVKVKPRGQVLTKPLYLAAHPLNETEFRFNADGRRPRRRRDTSARHVRLRPTG